MPTCLPACWRVPHGHAKEATSKVNFAIRGADFGLLADVRNRRLPDPVQQSDLKGKPSRHTPISPTLIKPAGPLYFTSTLSEFPDLTHQRQLVSPVKHDVFHHITNAGPPVHAQPRRLSPEKLVVARQELDHMLASSNHLPALGHLPLTWFLSGHRLTGAFVGSIKR